MSFGGGGGGWGTWYINNNNQQNYQSWRPYAQNQGGGPMRPPMPNPMHYPHYNPGGNGWLNIISNPYFGGNAHTQNHMAIYERNRMHFFHQPQPPPVQRPLVQNQHQAEMNEYVKQTLRNNAHVPGLRTGLQMRAAMNKRAKAREKKLEKKIVALPLTVNTNVFSEKIELRYHQPSDRKDIKFVITSENIKTKEIIKLEKPPTSLHCDLTVTAGETYKIEVECWAQDMTFLIANWSKKIRAEFSYSEQKRLLQKCYEFLKRGINAEPQMHEFCVLYRCKPKVYWDEIHHYCNDVMQKYIKDDNGQPGNLINGKINGLFFSARLNPDLSLPHYSPFGNVRMIVDAFLLLNPERHNFYFSDFYCNKSIHYTTIVICVVDSETDRYCRDKLVKLNPLSNPFVKLIPPTVSYGKWRFYINYTLWVEVYYTEDLQLDVGQFSAIMATGAGTSKIGGLPNNKFCESCNLYPARGKKQVTVEEAAVEISDLDSTMLAILRENSKIDSEVADTVMYLIDRVEERSLSAEELVEKLDKDLVKSIEDMNQAVKRDKNSIFASISKNLNDFVTGFNKRRDALVQKIKTFRSDS
ncbi:unnamed protein product [Caenorhabditis brenneri]